MKKKKQICNHREKGLIWAGRFDWYKCSICGKEIRMTTKPETKDQKMREKIVSIEVIDSDGNKYGYFLNEKQLEKIFELLEKMGIKCMKKYSRRLKK